MAKDGKTGYFLPIRDLLPRIATGSVAGSEAVFLAFASFALYADAGFMREQICKYACPYARFQGAMFDRATLTIFYDRKRGEPRGHRAKGSQQALGHCVDCKLCVHVCPTGIDIRNGTQYECIGCAACIDACDSVMAEVGFPKGLVRYTSESALDGNPRPILRSRTVAYGCVILAVAGLWTWGMLHRMPVALDVLADRGRLYRMVSAGDIENVYTLKVMNKAQHPATYRLSAEGGFVLEGPDTLTVQPGEVKTLPVELRAERRALSAVSTPVAFTVESVANAKVKARAESRFLAPASAIGHGREEHREAVEHAGEGGAGDQPREGAPAQDKDHGREAEPRTGERE